MSHVVGCGLDDSGEQTFEERKPGSAGELVRWFPPPMLFRNLASMDVEESIRADPIDSVVLLCGCDKTMPSLGMGEADLARRRAEWVAPEPAFKSGYQSLNVKHVLQADRGADFDFLIGCRGHEVPGSRNELDRLRAESPRRPRSGVNRNARRQYAICTLSEP